MKKTKLRRFARRELLLLLVVSLVAIFGVITLVLTRAASATLVINDNTIGTGVNQWSYTGLGWAYYTDGGNKYNGDDHSSGTSGDYATLKFHGTKAEYYGAKSPQAGIVGISVDNGTESMVDLYSGTRLDNTLLFSTATLTEGDHTMKIRLTGTKNANASAAAAAVDRAIVTYDPGNATFNSAEPEDGTLNGATIVSDGTASTGKAVNFPAPSTGTGAATYPLKMSPNNRYLVGANNKPFLYTADTSWALLTSVSRADADKYMDARKAQGYNTIQTVMTFPSRGQGLSGVNSVFRSQPFTNNDITKPNEAYFSVTDQMVQDAAARNLVLVVGGIWLGDNCNQKGGLPSQAALRTFGAWLGSRYKNNPNIIWFVGGDHDVLQNWDTDAGFDYTPWMDALAQGIKSTDSNHLVIYHPALNTFALGNFSWHAFYTYQENRADSTPWSYTRTRDYYQFSPTKAVLDMEPAYEPDDALTNTTTTPYMVRRNAWWSLLAGALGTTYGGPRATWFIGETSGNATAALSNVGLDGAKQNGLMPAMLKNFDWSKLVPDWGHAGLTAGYGTYNGNDYATSGVAPDGSLLMAYLPSARTATVNMAKLSGASSAYWLDPTTGTSTTISTSLANSGSKTFTTPGNHSDGKNDWVLVVDAN